MGDGRELAYICIEDSVVQEKVKQMGNPIRLKEALDLWELHSNL